MFVPQTCLTINMIFCAKNHQHPNSEFYRSVSKPQKLHIPFYLFQYPAPLPITCNALLCPHAASLSHGLHLGWRTAMAFCRNMGSFIDPWSYGKVSYHPHFKVHSAYPDPMNSQCLKIAQKVAFNIASEASYTLISNRQKLIKNAKNCPFRRILKNATFWVFFKHCLYVGCHCSTKQN